MRATRGVAPLLWPRLLGVADAVMSAKTNGRVFPSDLSIGVNRSRRYALYLQSMKYFYFR